MTRGLLLFTFVVFCASLAAQEPVSLDNMRQSFQAITSEEDIQEIMDISIDSRDPDASTVRAYQAASTCMMAEYVFSTIKKLKYFNQGKSSLENLIAEEKSVENIYLRLLIQLNIPRLLNYYKNVDEVIAFLESQLPAAKIDVEYKYNMIRNLVTLADKDELKEVLLGIKVTGTDEKL